jgi:hypothetical protein
MYLERYHDVDISQSGVWRILKRVDLSRLPASQRYQRHDRKWKRYEKPMPGHAVQIDVKFIAPLSAASKKKYYQFMAIDDCTRLRVLRIYDQLNQKNRDPVRRLRQPPTRSGTPAERTTGIRPLPRAAPEA